MEERNSNISVMELKEYPGFIIVKAAVPHLSSRDRIVSTNRPSKATGNEVCIDLTGNGPCYGYAMIRSSGSVEHKYNICLNPDDCATWTPEGSYFKLKKEFVKLYLKKKE